MQWSQCGVREMLEKRGPGCGICGGMGYRVQRMGFAGCTGTRIWGAGPREWIVGVASSEVRGWTGCRGPLSVGAAGPGPRGWGRKAGRAAAAPARARASLPLGLRRGRGPVADRPSWAARTPSATRRGPPLRAPLSFRLRRPLEPPLPRCWPPHVGRGPSPPRGRPARPARSVAADLTYATSVAGRARRPLRSRRHRWARVDVTARGGDERRARRFAAAGSSDLRPPRFAAAPGLVGRCPRVNGGARPRRPARAGREPCCVHLWGTVLSPPAPAHPAVAMARRGRLAALPRFRNVTVSPPDVTAGRRRGCGQRWVWLTCGVGSCGRRPGWGQEA